MPRKQSQRFSVCALVFLAAVLLWHPDAGHADDDPAATNVPVVVRKTAPGRLQNAVPQAQLYFGPRLEPVTTSATPQNPYESSYASYLHSYYKAIIGFRFALTAHAYLFVGVGMAISDGLLAQGLGRNVNNATQSQNALGMQTEYGLGWDF